MPNAILQLISIQFNSIHIYQVPTIYLAPALGAGNKWDPFPDFKDLTAFSDGETKSLKEINKTSYVTKKVHIKCDWNKDKRTCFLLLHYGETVKRIWLSAQVSVKNGVTIQ